MADDEPRVTLPAPEFSFDGDRVTALLRTLEHMATGRLDERLPISSRHDTLDAIAHAVNVLVGELKWAGDRAKAAQDEKEARLRADVASAEARNGAILKAIPDLMFIMLRDGTYVDYYARDPKLLFVPPATFLGKTARAVLPPPLAERIMEAIERASASDDPVLLEYELPMDEPRTYEARIVRAGDGRFLSIVRDVTEAKRASEVNRDLAGRLIARQEKERQRVARELHDDVSQRLALLNIEIDEVTRYVASEESRARLRKLSVQAGEIARDVHYMSYELHPSRLRIVGIVSALEALCRDTWKQRNLPVAFIRGAIPPVHEDISLCLYRIVQEALHNVVRHSHATKARVSVSCQENHVVLQIADDGIGFDPRSVHHAGLGLVSMRERVTVVKGQLTVDTAPGSGTHITIRIPLDPQAVGSVPRLPATV